MSCSLFSPEARLVGVILGTLGRQGSVGVSDSILCSGDRRRGVGGSVFFIEGTIPVTCRLVRCGTTLAFLASFSFVFLAS